MLLKTNHNNVQEKWNCYLSLIILLIVGKNVLFYIIVKIGGGGMQL